MSVYQSIQNALTRRNGDILTDQCDTSIYPAYIRFLKMHTEDSKRRYLKIKSLTLKIEFVLLYMVLNEEIEDYKKKLMRPRHVVPGRTEEVHLTQKIKYFIDVSEKCWRLYKATDRQQYKNVYTGIKNTVNVLFKIFEMYKIFDAQMKVKITSESVNHKRFLGFFAR